MGNFELFNMNLMNVSYVISVLLCSVLFIYCLKWFAKQWRINLMLKKLPRMKSRPFDLMGDVKHLLRNGILKMHPINLSIGLMLSAYTELFREKKLFVIWFGLTPVVIIVKAEAVEGLISGTRNLEKGWGYDMLHPWLGTGLLTSHGGKWKSRRKMLTPAFHFDILKEFLPIINEQSQVLIQTLMKEVGKPEIDIVKPVTLCSLDIICETTLGVRISAQVNSDSEYVRAVNSIGAIAMERFIKFYYWPDKIFRYSNIGNQFYKDLKLLHSFTRKVIANRKRELLSGDSTIKSGKRKAFMDLLLENHIYKNSLTEEDVREEVDTFTFEGHDTTAMGLSWSLYLIGLHQDVQAKIHAELDNIFRDDTERDVTPEDLRDMNYLECVIKESLRLYPSVPLIARQLNEDVDLCGYTIPKGVMCGIDTHQLHRDKDVFPEPEKFDPDRFLTENSKNRHPFAYIPFSAGSRNCIGQRFATMELKTVIAHVLRKFCIESIDPRDKINTSIELVLRAMHPLKIKFYDRN